jgi:ribonuclease VapC
LIVVDTSVLIAILLAESDAADLAEKIERASPRLLSAASLLEAAIVIESRKGDDGARDLDLFIYRAGLEIVPVDAEQAEVARIAWRRYGKGRDTAGLNYGDCFAYALAKVNGAKLIYKGDDFGRTDLA